MIKLRLLPPLPERIWFAVWCFAVVVMLSHWAGAWWEAWPHDIDLVMACSLVLLLLMFTPPEHSLKTIYIGRPPQCRCCWRAAGSWCAFECATGLWKARTF